MTQLGFGTICERSSFVLKFCHLITSLALIFSCKKFSSFFARFASKQLDPVIGFPFPTHRSLRSVKSVVCLSIPSTPWQIRMRNSWPKSHATQSVSQSMLSKTVVFLVCNIFHHSNQPTVFVRSQSAWLVSANQSLAYDSRQIFYIIFRWWGDPTPPQLYYY